MKLRTVEVRILLGETTADVYVLLEVGPDDRSWRHSQFPRLTTVELAEATYQAILWPVVPGPP